MKLQKFLSAAAFVLALAVPSAGYAYRDCSNLEIRYEDAKTRVDNARNAWVNNSDYRLSEGLKAQYANELDR